jgi:hypothetical protein
MFKKRTLKGNIKKLSVVDSSHEEGEQDKEAKNEQVHDVISVLKEEQNLKKKLRTHRSEISTLDSLSVKPSITSNSYKSIESVMGSQFSSTMMDDNINQLSNLHQQIMNKYVEERMGLDLMKCVLSI